MNHSLEYEHLDLLAFGGTIPQGRSFDESPVVILPVPLDRTTSYAGGTRNGPREILLASSQLELWDEEVHADVHGVGICTLPEMAFPFGEMEPTLAEIRRLVSGLLARDKFPVILGGEHSITVPAVAAAAARYPELSVLQIDAHADLRDSYMGSRYNHACAMRRVLEHARGTQVGVRSISAEEARVLPTLPTTVFFDVSMRRDADWMDKVVRSLGETVYITVDCDGLDPSVMPAVGTPEPGGLSWYEMLALLRAVMSARHVVGCDVVELCPIPGLVAPNFLCAKLVAKMLTYRFVRAA